MVLLTVVSFEPVTVCVVDLLPYVPLTVPYSNQAVVDSPLAFTVPVSVADVDVTFVAEPVVTVGGCAVVAVYVIVMVSVFVLPAPSFPVTVITLSPLERLMLDIVQLAVPLAVPLPPLLLLHDTSLMPLVLSDALPLNVIVLLVDV